jgi:hypothetical protein
LAVPLSAYSTPPDLPRLQLLNQKRRKRLRLNHHQSIPPKKDSKRLHSQLLDSGQRLQPQTGESSHQIYKSNTTTTERLGSKRSQAHTKKLKFGRESSEHINDNFSDT